MKEYTGSEFICTIPHNANGEKTTIREIAIKATDGRPCDLEVPIEQNNQKINDAAITILKTASSGFAVASPITSGQSTALGRRHPPMYTDPVDKDNDEEKDL